MRPRDSYSLLLKAYRCAEWLVYPPVFLALVLLNAHKADRLRHIIRRLTWARGPSEPWNQGEGPDIWVHALSFGEVRASLPLLSAMRQRWPRGVFVASSSTLTGFNELKKRADDIVDHIVPMPYDFTPCLLRMARSFAPKCFVLVETDVWPNLLWRFKERGTRIVLANGSISSRAKGRLCRAKWVARFLYGPFDHICMQAKRDRDRLIQLGIEPGRVSAFGSLKFDTIPSLSRDELAFEIKKELGLEGDNRINCVFGSLHEGEEEVLLVGIKHLRDKLPVGRVKFIVAPRYPEFAKKLKMRLSDAGISALLRTEIPSHPSNIQSKNMDCLVVDTLGELMKFYAVSHIAILGGTFVPVGGHNVLEPASLGIPTVVGPYIESIEDICLELQKEGAIMRVDSASGFSDVLLRLISSPRLRVTMGKKALDYVNARRGVCDRYVKLLEGYLNDAH